VKVKVPPSILDASSSTKPSYSTVKGENAEPSYVLFLFSAVTVNPFFATSTFTLPVTTLYAVVFVGVKSTVAEYSPALGTRVGV